MAKTISKDTPITELTIRKYEKPYNLDKRELVRKLCLSLGLLQPGDSRDIVVDILYIMLETAKNRQELTSEDVRGSVVELRKNYKLPLQGIASSNIRRQLKRLRDVYLIEKIRNNYRMTENLAVSEIFKEKISQHMLNSIIGRVEEYVQKIDEEFRH